jgi:hypothetical protein
MMACRLLPPPEINAPIRMSAAIEESISGALSECQ